MVKDSRFNRRITAETPIDIGGPARGAALMRTQADPDGVRALGTFGNCAGGETPWGTYLTAEENIQDYFGNLDQLKARSDVDPHIVESHRRLRMWKAHSLYCWEVVDARFDLPQHADASRSASAGSSRSIRAIRRARRSSAPRSAASRTKARARSSRTTAASPCTWATTTSSSTSTSSSPTAASMRRIRPRIAICSIAARCTSRASMRAAAAQWLPLVFDPKGPLNAAAGFRDQAEVLIKARAAATLLGATPMDRPEDVEANPVTGRIYVACTRNEQRTRVPRRRMTYAGREVDVGTECARIRAARIRSDTSSRFAKRATITPRASFRGKCSCSRGDPAGGTPDHRSDATCRQDSAYYAGYANADELSPIGSPDNIGFDRAGNLWIVTDGTQPRGTNDGCWVCPTDGPQRGRLQQFMSGPVGAEICGCQFTPDCETLFLSIQHPGEGGSVVGADAATGPTDRARSRVRASSRSREGRRRTRSGSRV